MSSHVSSALLKNRLLLYTINMKYRLGTHLSRNTDNCWSSLCASTCTHTHTHEHTLSDHRCARSPSRSTHVNQGHLLAAPVRPRSWIIRSYNSETMIWTPAAHEGLQAPGRTRWTALIGGSTQSKAPVGGVENPLMTYSVCYEVAVIYRLPVPWTDPGTSLLIR